jgi:hypothetical protein
LDGLVVAWCRPEQQIERLLARGLSEAEARRRIMAQMPVEEKLKFATEKIDCSGSMEETRRQVQVLAEKLRRKRGNEIKRYGNKDERRRRRDENGWGKRLNLERVRGCERIGGASPATTGS